MAYRGQTFIIPLDKGGLAGNPNANNLPAEMMVEVRNININEGERSSRGGTDHINASAISGTPRIMNFFDFILKNGNQFQVIVTDAGEILKNPATTLKTGWSINNPASFEVFREKLYICGGTSVPQTWDGSAANTSDLANTPADWTGTSFPKQIIKHGRGNSERLWAIGAAENPYTIYVSANGTDNFSDTVSIVQGDDNGNDYQCILDHKADSTNRPVSGDNYLRFWKELGTNGTGSVWGSGNDYVSKSLITMNIETGDGAGIIGGIEFGDRIIFFSKSRAYIIDDTSVDTAQWGYAEAQWASGAANFRTIVRTPNDIIAMMEDGEIYSFTAAQSYGDYKAASLLKADDIQVWIKTHIDLTRIDQFHGLYDPTGRRVIFFMVSKANVQVDTALIYYIDTKKWVTHDSLDNIADSGYNASCSGIVRESVGSYRVHTGDYKGFLWKLEQNSNNDNGNGYYSGWTHPPIDFTNLRTRKQIKRGRMISVGKGDWDVKVKWAVDEVQKTERTVNQFGSGFLLGSATDGLLGTSSMGSDSPQIDKLFQFGAIGKNLTLEVYNDNADEAFTIKTLLLDHKTLGMKP